MTYVLCLDFTHRRSFLAFASLLVALSFLVVPPANAAVSPFQSLFLASPSKTASAATTATPAKIDYQALEQMLQDPRTRAALIATLQRLAAEQNKQGVKATPSVPAKAGGMAVEGTNFTGVFLDSINALIAQSITALNSLKALGDSLLRSPQALGHWRDIGRLAWPVGVVTLLMYIILWGFRLLLRRPIGKLYSWAARGNENTRLLRGLLMILVQAMVGAAVIMAAWSAGGVAATWLAGKNTTLHMLFAALLHTFLLVESLHLAVVLLLGDLYSISKLLGRSADVSRRFRAPLTRMVMWLGYGLAFVAPMTERLVNPSLGHALVWLIGLIAYIDAIRVVLARREAVSEAFAKAAERHRESALGWLLSVLGRTWWAISLAYITVLFFALLLRPGDVLPFIAHASALTLVYVLAALLLSRFINQWLKRRWHVPPGVARRLPSLQRRLDQLQPYLLAGTHTTIAVILFAALADVWHVIDVLTWLSTPTGQLVLGRLVLAAIISIVILVTWVLVDSLVEARLQAEGDRIPSARAKTLLGLFRIVFGITLAVIGGMMVLSSLGVNIGPLLAGASVLGLAVGFGSQKLVQDVINGIFIQVENAINVGDVVTVGAITGTAEMVSIRSVRLRDVYGTYHIIPYSSVNEVSNFSHGYANCVAVYGIAYREDIDAATQVLHEAFDELMQDETVSKNILEPMVVQGVVALNNSSVDIRISIKVAPGTQWGVQRAMNRLVKIHFDKAGIEIPFPQQTIWFGEDKDGSAPPARLRIESTDDNPPAAST